MIGRRHLRRLAAGLTLAGALAAVPAALAKSSNLVRNGSFEKPALLADQPSLFIEHFKTGNWRMQHVSLLNSVPADGYPAFAGLQSLELGSDGHISQTELTAPAGTYTVSFEATPDYTNGCATISGVRSGQVSLDGNLIGSFTPPGDASQVVWTHYSFTAPAQIATIDLNGTSDTSCGVILDDVRLTPAA
jgi:hypothetical protein